jgi:hypothetical protein
VDPVDALLRPVALSGGICAATALLGQVVARRSPRAGDALVAAGVAAGFMAGLAASGIRPSLPPAPSEDAWTWVFWLAPGAGLVGVVDAAIRGALIPRILARTLVGALGAWLVIAPLVPHALSTAGALTRVAVAGIAAAALWTALSTAAERRAKASLALPVVVALVATSGILLEAGRSLVMATTAGVLATCVAATALVRSRGDVSSLSATAAPIVAVVLVALLAGAHAYLAYGTVVRFPAESGLSLVAAAASALVRRWPLSTALAVALSAVAALAALLRAPPG